MTTIKCHFIREDAPLLYAAFILIDNKWDEKTITGFPYLIFVYIIMKHNPIKNTQIMQHLTTFKKPSLMNMKPSQK
jgi:hypothetical protein